MTQQIYQDSNELLREYTKILKDEDFKHKSKRPVYKRLRHNYIYKYTTNRNGESVITKEGEEYWKKTIISIVDGHVYKNIEKKEGNIMNKYQKCIEYIEEDIMSDFEII